MFEQTTDKTRPVCFSLSQSIYDRVEALRSDTVSRSRVLNVIISQGLDWAESQKLNQEATQ